MREFCFVIAPRHFSFEDAVVDGLLIFDHLKFKVLPASTTMLDLLVLAGIFPSKGQARKNWKGPTDLQEGLNSHPNLGKLKTTIHVQKIPERLQTRLEDPQALMEN